MDALQGENYGSDMFMWGNYGKDMKQWITPTLEDKINPLHIREKRELTLLDICWEKKVCSASDSQREAQGGGGRGRQGLVIYHFCQSW